MRLPRGKWLPHSHPGELAVAKVGAHLAALVQPHAVRNRVFAHRPLRKGLDDRRNRGRRRFGHAHLFETGDYRIRPPAEGSRGQQVSQRQTSRTEQRQNLQTRPHADEVHFRSRRRASGPAAPASGSRLCAGFRRACAGAAAAFVATDFSARFPRKARRRGEKLERASNFTVIHRWRQPVRSG